MLRAVQQRRSPPPFSVHAAVEPVGKVSSDKEVSLVIQMSIAAHKEILVRFGYIGPQRWEQVKERNVRLSGKKTNICLRQIDIVVVPRHTPTIDLVTRRKGYDDQPSTVRTGQIVDSRQRFERNILGPDRNLRVGKLRGVVARLGANC